VSVNKKGRSLLPLIIYRDYDIRLINILIRNGMFINDTDAVTTAVSAAAFKRDENLVQTLLEYGANLSIAIKGYSANMYVSQNMREYAQELKRNKVMSLAQYALRFRSPIVDMNAIKSIMSDYMI
jgi:nicotinamide riboside kinase